MFTERNVGHNADIGQKAAVDGDDFVDLMHEKTELA
jgi:hypothetical protein